MIRTSDLTTEFLDSLIDPDGAAILGEARRRFARGASMRHLRKPAWAPPASRWSVQRRKLRNGRPVAYLFLRWFGEGDNRLRAKSLGRLDNAA